jgi:FkbM family methyltransferase
MILDLQKEKDYWLGTYETDLQEAIARFVQPGMVVYDVGANIGYISLMLARRTGDHGQVTAFEALPANLERLRANVELNGLSEKVKIVSGAVTDSDVPVRFLVHQSGSMGKADGSAGRTTEVYDGEISVPGIALDKYVFENGNPCPDVIKMDIEGFEAVQVVVQALWEYGYQVHRLQSDYPVVDSLDGLDWKAYIMGAPGDLG